MSILLIIGNGFDIANGLPTSYKSFLEYMKEAKKYYNREYSSKLITIKDSLNLSRIMHYKGLYNKSKFLAEKTNLYPLKAAWFAFIAYADKLFNNKNIFDHMTMKKDIYFNFMKKEIDDIAGFYTKLYEYNACLLYVFLCGNMWLEYFKEINVGEKWIDFEKEISKVIERIEYILINDKDGENRKVLSSKYGDMPIRVFMSNQDIIDRSMLRGRKGYISRLQSELVIFVRCLEIYMLLVEQIPDIYIIEKVSVIENLGEVNWLLNFNYTDTFLRLYGMGVDQANADFIHGRAGYNNLIIGTQETLENENENILLDCIYFKKYFQRIFYKTGMGYKKWIANEVVCGNDIDVYIFGHSMDVTDGEILKYIIMNPDVKSTKIFYHSQDSYINMIKNLIKIIGKDNLIAMTGDEKITFLSTKDEILYM